MAGLRPEFEAGLRLFGRASDVLAAQGKSRPILVGGAAVEVYTNGSITTGDFDIVTPWQSAFEQVLTTLGFERPTGKGVATRGWIHPRLALGFEVVSSTLLDGLADEQRVILVELDEDGAAAVISVEDMIADRLAQYCSGSAPEMREQAQRLFDLHDDVDRDYLARRIAEETGNDFRLEDLEANRA